MYDITPVVSQSSSSLLVQGISHWPVKSLRMLVVISYALNRRSLGSFISGNPDNTYRNYNPATLRAHFMIRIV